PVERLLPFREHAPFLDLARTLSDRIVDVLARIHQQMLQVGFNARRDVRKRFAMDMVASGTHAGKVVLCSLDIALESEIARLEHDLEEADIPSNLEFVPDTHVVGGDRLETRIDIAVPALEEAH